jgi:hypothetical protein
MSSIAPSIAGDSRGNRLALFAPLFLAMKCPDPLTSKKTWPDDRAEAAADNDDEANDVAPVASALGDDTVEDADGAEPTAFDESEDSVDGGDNGAQPVSTAFADASDGADDADCAEPVAPAPIVAALADGVEADVDDDGADVADPVLTECDESEDAADAVASDEPIAPDDAECSVDDGVDGAEATVSGETDDGASVKDDPEDGDDAVPTAGYSCLASCSSFATTNGASASGCT